MKTNPLFYGILIVALAFAYTLFGLRAAEKSDAATPVAQPAPVVGQKWEHLALTAIPRKGVNDPELSRKIVGLGNDGWELVTVLNFTRDGTTYQTVYYFKKPQ